MQLAEKQTKKSLRLITTDVKTGCISSLKPKNANFAKVPKPKGFLKMQPAVIIESYCYVPLLFMILKTNFY